MKLLFVIGLILVAVGMIALRNQSTNAILDLHFFNKPSASMVVGVLAQLAGALCIAGAAIWWALE